MEAAALKKVARQLFQHYYAKLMAETKWIGTVDSMHMESLEAQPAKTQTAFQKASLSCSGAGAKPSEWINAQFDKFEEFTKFIGKPIVPQPQQLFGITAHARYVQWKKEKQEDTQREERSLGGAIHSGFKLEERNLKALCRSMRMPETEVLCKKPDEFSVDFLKSKGIYKVVKKRRTRLLGEAA